MAKQLSFKIGSEKITSTYNCNIPEWFPNLFGEMSLAYYIAAKFSNRIDLSKFHLPIAELLKSYFHNKKQDTKYINSPKENKSITCKRTGNNIAVMLSGGKDSVHLLLKLSEKLPKNNIICFYTPSLNKSEQYYEKKAVKKICSKLEIKLIILDLKCSVKLNRMNHNISLREQLIYTICLPYLIENECSIVYWGNCIDFYSDNPSIYSASKSALDFVNEYLGYYGIEILQNNHSDIIKNFKSNIIFEEMTTKYKEYLDLTSSCYSQLNFKETKHKRLKAKFSDIELYNGCGSCIKCLRINAALLLYRDKNHPEGIKLLNHIINVQKKNHPKDKVLLFFVNQLRKTISQHT